MNKTIGVLCINLGSPSSPKPQDVRRYLHQFFNDSRLISNTTVRSLVRWIVPWIRANKSAKKYQKIWIGGHDISHEQWADLAAYGSEDLQKTAGQSPLVYHSLKLVQQLDDTLNHASHPTCSFVVKLAMNIGQPSVKALLNIFDDLAITELVVVPLFPQYASCTTGASLDQVYKLISQHSYTEALRVLPPFGEDHGYIHVLATMLKDHLREQGLTEMLSDNEPSFHVVISFHGLPLSSCLAKTSQASSSSQPKYPCGDPSGRCCDSDEHLFKFCYRRQCVTSAHQLAQACDLNDENYTVSFQSRVGPQTWTGPDTLDTLEKLGSQKLKQIIIICPSFITDCLETLEEIHIEAKELITSRYPHLDVSVVSCINDHPLFSKFLTQKITGACGDLMGDDEPKTLFCENSSDNRSS